MKYYCIECGRELIGITSKPKFCNFCGHPQSSEAAATRAKAKIKTPELDEEEEEIEENLPIPTLKLQVEVPNWESNVVKLGSVLGTSQGGRDSFVRPRNDDYVTKIREKFKTKESIDVAL